LKSFSLILNALKITAAAVLAAALAAFCHLDFSVSAGIIAILSIQPTKKETLWTAASRFAAFVCAVGIAFLCFSLLGYNLPAFGVYLFFFIGLCLRFGWNSAMAMDSVLITHFLTTQDFSLSMAVNEFLLFVIGVSAGILVNLSLRKDTRGIERLKADTDNQIRKILSRMSERVLTNDLTDYNGDCFQELWDDLGRARNLAETNFGNALSGTDVVYDKEYLSMRTDQCHVLYEMYKEVRHLNTTPVQAQKISSFLRKVSEEYDQNNTVEGLLKDLKILDDGMKQEPMPQSRAEFEDRARLFSLIGLLEEFLRIKNEFAMKYPNPDLSIR